LFDHRVVSLFYRAWEKYRFWAPYERGEAFRREPDTFTNSVFSLIGLGSPNLRGRLRVAERTGNEEQPERVLARIDDLGLLYYAGLFAQRPRSAIGLEAVLGDFFELPAAVRQFQGQWLLLDKSDQTCLGGHGSLGVDAVAGDRVFDVQTKFRVRLGPLKLRRFEEFLPDHSPTPRRKSLFLLAQLVRLYVGPELDFDVQLVLDAAETPASKLGGAGFGSRLGWNTWLLSQPRKIDAEDATFAPDESIWIN
jgi:type VI secretion system protein ImpH